MTTNIKCPNCKYHGALFYGKKFNEVQCSQCGEIFIPQELKDDDKFAENLIRSFE